MAEYNRRQFIKHLCRNITDSDLYGFILEYYDEDKWNQVVEHIWIQNEKKSFEKKDYIISVNADKLSIKLKNQFGIYVFPVIFRTRAGKWTKADGTFSWYMYTTDLKIVGGWQSIQKFAVQRNIIEMSYNRGDTCLDVYTPSEYKRVKEN